MGGRLLRCWLGEPPILNCFLLLAEAVQVRVSISVDWEAACFINLLPPYSKCVLLVC